MLKIEYQAQLNSKVLLRDQQRQIPVILDHKQHLLQKIEILATLCLAQEKSSVPEEPLKELHIQMPITLDHKQEKKRLLILNLQEIEK